jgi:hypothetical protein
MCRKSDVLDAGGYVFDNRYGVYVNISKKALFSHQFVDAYSAEELEARIVARGDTTDWQFFCTIPTPPSIREQVIAAYSR